MEPLAVEDIAPPIITPPTAEQKAKRQAVQRSLGVSETKTKKALKKCLKLNTIIVSNEEFINAAQTTYSTPMELFSQKMYQKLTGIITYIANKGRFDLQVHASLLAQYNSMPTPKQFFQALQVLRFAYTTRNSMYIFPKLTAELPESTILELYTDAARSAHSSQGGFIMILDGKYCGSKSYRIKETSTSSYHSEMLALREGVTHALAQIPILKDLGFKNISLQVYCDNLSVINSVTKFNANSKPLNLTYQNCLYYLQSSYNAGYFQLEHISGKLNPADLLTKSLRGNDLKRLLTETKLCTAFNLVIEDEQLISKVIEEVSPKFNTHTKLEPTNTENIITTLPEANSLNSLIPSELLQSTGNNSNTTDIPPMVLAASQIILQNYLSKQGHESAFS